MADTFSKSNQLSNLSTIGYEKSSIDDFIQTLVTASVDTLVDVRERPLSRKKGFSKNSLRAALSEVGISYIHFKELGDPKEGREAAKAGDYDLFREIYSQHIQSIVAKTALTELASIVATKKSCLMCFERNPKECHRNLLSLELQKIVQLEIRHLGVNPIGNKLRPTNKN